MNDQSLPAAADNSSYAIFCFCHLRWDFVYQRPQHVMSRFADRGRVFFVEEPMPSDQDSSHLEVMPRGENLIVLRPRLTEPDKADIDAKVAQMLADFAAKEGVDKLLAWYYTPMMLDWASGLKTIGTVYDCMDELAAFKGAPPELLEREQRLFELADVVFTGGRSLYEAKKSQHHNVYAFPSSIDVEHFSKALEIDDEAPEQAEIGRPRVGFAGVIDERLDIEIVRGIAELRPEINFVMVGPVVKIDESSLPRLDNIFYLGAKEYSRLPELMAGWDVAMMPFALNESTRFISPTKTPEYLAAGLPVVSTPIADVVRPYGVEGYVRIASSAKEFVEAIDAVQLEDGERRRARVREMLAGMSWDKTFTEMNARIGEALSSGHGKMESPAVGSQTFTGSATAATGS